MKKTGFLYDVRYLLHDTGPYHPEAPERLTAIYKGIEAGALLSQTIQIQGVRARRRWIEAVHDPRVFAAARLTHPDGGASGTRVSIDFPAEILSDGVQIVSLRSTVTGAVLDRITFLAGDILDDDIRAEIALLRDELEMLKRAFRRHVGTQAG